MGSKKSIVVALFAGVFILLGGIFALKISDGTLSYTSENASSLVASNNPAFETPNPVDTDHDGLFDWEEILWHTDPKKPDSDEDGMSDGEEAKTNRDPAVKGAGNLSALKGTAGASTTATSKLSLDILATYLKLKQASETGGSIENIPSGESLLDKNTVTISAPQYTLSDLRNVPDSDATKRTYGEGMVAITNRYFPSNQQNEMEILQKSLEQEDEAPMKILSKRAEDYRLAAKELLAMSVPTGALTYHMSFTNSISVMAESVYAMSKMYSDPVTGLAGLQQYQNAGVMLAKSARELGNYFVKQ